MSIKRQPTRFRSKCRYFAKCSRNFIKSRQKYSKYLRSSGSLRVLWTGEKSNLFSNTFISVSVRILWLRLKTVLEQKTQQVCPSSVKVALLIAGSSVVIDPPSSVLLISLQISLIWEMFLLNWPVYSQDLYH